MLLHTTGRVKPQKAKEMFCINNRAYKIYALSLFSRDDFMDFEELLKDKMV